jgi:ribosomal protein S17
MLPNIGFFRATSRPLRSPLSISLLLSTTSSSSTMTTTMMTITARYVSYYTVRPTALSRSARSRKSSCRWVASSSTSEPSQSSNPVARNADSTPAATHSSPSSSLSPSSILSTLRQYPYRTRTGTVVTAGRMDRTVRVAHRHTTWDRHIRKWYARVTTYLVSDPRNSLREGDVIEFSSGAPKSRRVHHVVERIVSPFGVAIEERPPVMNREERDAERARKRAEKLERREQRRKLRSSSAEGQSAKTEMGTYSSAFQGDHIGRIKKLVLQRVAQRDRCVK